MRAARNSDRKQGEWKLRLPASDLVVFLSSLATMVKAGVPLYRALCHLGEHSETPAAELLAQDLAQQVQSGRPLSRAMSAHPGIFSSLQVGLVRVAEKTGTLDDVLERLAESDMRSQKLSRQLKSALTYPALLMAACCLAVVLAPPLLLQPILQMIRDMHVPVPFITQLLLWWSDALRSPLAWAAGVTAALAGGRWLHHCLRNPLVVSRLTRKALRVPRVGALLRHVLCARIARTMQLQLGAGVQLLEALHLAGQANGNPLVVSEMDDICRAVLAGRSMTKAMEKSELFPTVFTAVVQCGEETGDLTQMFRWLADLHEDEVQNALGSFMAVIEPLLMGGAGLVVGTLVVATMLPMSRALDAI